ncbi:hypothetical protein MAPG_04967 [Magnaporthiopsis poae ATCC 64411]|uniref:Uncharacterized protein n=1 Tax=Magnaporthiopsis poae (strain ATCC 64411 / 73-15) TaxID=644358 RepID=A0A0C4DY57_MAGP6|nr:hypothetical protein MAPG_04967 [Magnaporthiopsis poae ATCC 64411]
MLFPIALLVTSLTLASAFRVPEGQAAGVYRAYYDAEGKGTATVIALGEPEIGTPD